MPSMKLKYLPKSIEEAWQIAERENPKVNSALFREEAARFAVDKVRGELLRMWASRPVMVTVVTPTRYLKSRTPLA